MRKCLNRLVAALIIATVPAAASASPLLGYITGQGNDANDCAGVFGTPPNCKAFFPLDWTPESGRDPLLAPTPLIGKYDYETTGNKWTFGTFPSIDGSEFSVSLNNIGNNGGGSWTYTPGPGDPLITAFVIKDANGFWLYIDPALNS
jgi:hypothetical protein